MIESLSSLQYSVSESTKKTVLRWKFNYYDRNGDGALSTPEEYIFQLDLYQFVKCKSFFDHVSYVMDEDKDGIISFNEWNIFFYTEHTGEFHNNNNRL